MLLLTCSVCHYFGTTEISRMLVCVVVLLEHSCVCVCVCAKESLAKKSPSAQVLPVQSSVQMQVNPIGFSTQVAPLTHGDDKQACSTDEDEDGEDKRTHTHTHTGM